MKMLRVLTVCLVAGSITFGIIGCESSEPSNMMENADQDALAEYEKAIAEDAAAMTEEEADEIE